MVVGLDSFSGGPRAGKLIAGGELEGVRGVTTSEWTEALARKVGVPLVALWGTRDHHRRRR